MQLIGMMDSPYVRRVAVSLSYLGLPYSHRSVSVFRHYDTFAQINPLVKAPTLLLDDGQRLHDSNLILQYVEQRAQAAGKGSLWPSQTASELTELTRALSITANALVAMEKTVQCVYEFGVRPAEKAHQPWLDRISGQLHAAYALLETVVTPVAARGYLFGERLTQADITLVAAWGFTQFVESARVPAAQYPALQAYATRLEQLPAFKDNPVDKP